MGSLIGRQAGAHPRRCGAVLIMAKDAPARAAHLRVPPPLLMIAAGNVGIAARGEDCTACGVGCGGAGNGAMSYVGSGQGDYIAETTYQYVGYGGDFSRPRRDFTCLITAGCLLSLLLLIPLLLWLLAGTPTTPPPFACNTGVNMMMWSQEQQTYCCVTAGLCAPEPTEPATAFPTSPPTPPPTPTGTPPPKGDPFNCAVDAENLWAADKKAWCCKVHHKGCPPTPPPVVPMPPVIPPVVMPIIPRPPADPYNCADGFANWQAGWLEHPEEDVVLCERRKGLPTAGRRLCLRMIAVRLQVVAEVLALVGAGALSLLLVGHELRERTEGPPSTEQGVWHCPGAGASAPSSGA